MSEKKRKKVVKVQKTPKKILEYYYMTPEQVNAKALSLTIHSMNEEQIEVWPDLNLMEVVMPVDSLIFQDASQCFVDEVDLAFLKEKGIQSMYQVSFDVSDLPVVRQVLAEILEGAEGFLASDTDDFMPMYTKESIGTL